jgi:hypothetical protein
MRTIRLHGLAAAAALAVLFAPALARADAVTQWNEYATTAITVTAAQPPHVASLSFAMVQGAVYDAVNGIDRGHQPYLTLPAANPWDSQDAAAATAAYRVLVNLFPAQQTTLQPLYDASLAAVPDGPMKTGGIAAGEAAAAAMIAARTNDGRGGPQIAVIGTTPGAWRPTPPTFPGDPGSWVANVRPFLVPDATALLSDPPNALTSNAYAKDLNEVKSVGALNSTTRTADETEAALFWQDHGGAIWNRVFRALAAGQGLDSADAARLLAMTNLAAADAAIGCWYSKYHWSSWRPITAIREAGTDGNSKTEADPTWLPLFDPSTATFGTPLVTPGFPEHPSGHSCLSSAITHTLRTFFRTDEMTFSAFSNRTRTTRTFHSFSQALDEVIDARVWAGIHFRTGDVDGARLGKEVAQYLRKNYFKPLR